MRRASIVGVPASPFPASALDEGQHVLGLDLGTWTGWGLIRVGGGRVGSGAWEFGHDRAEGGGVRFLRFRRHVLEILADRNTPVGLVAVEQVMFGAKGADAAQVYGGFLAALTTLCEERRVPYEGVSTSEVKTWARGVIPGKGTPGKEDVVRAVNSHFGLNIPVDDKRGHDDEADSLIVAAISEQKYRVLR